MKDNGRAFTRISFKHKADLIANDNNYPIQIIDLSMRGMLVTKPENIDIDIDDECEIIMSPAIQSQDELEFIVKVQHIKDDSIGLIISETDIDSFTSILDIISATDGDSAKIQDEITNSLE